jgi:CheY-like chemotaxis protein
MGGGPGGAAPARRRRVLVVEDDPATRAVVVEALNDEPDLFAEGVDGGAAALGRLADRSDIDLVLCDLSMSDVDGFELAARLKENPATARLPVVAMTALDASAVEAGLGLAGYAAVVAKPFDLTDLATLVRGLLPMAHADLD